MVTIYGYLADYINMPRRDKKVFTRRPHDKFLYRWSPETSLNRPVKEGRQVDTSCNATAG